MVKRIRMRTIFIGGCITLAFFILAARIFWFQVIDRDFWLQEAKKTWTGNIKIKSQRGEIYDCHGNALALNAPAYTVAVNPKVLNKLQLVNRVVDKLHEVLGKSKAELEVLATAKKKNSEFYTQREVRKEGWKIELEKGEILQPFIEELQKEKKQADIGLYLLKEQKRYYPKNRLAAHVLGYINKEEEAVTGLEYSLDSLLRGVDGSISYEKDRYGYKLPTSEEVRHPEKNGKNIHLTIDETIQHITEEAIQKIYEKYHPKSITAIAMNPHTGAVLAMADYPNFDPNKYWETKKQEDFFQHAVRSNYEPGSTFKIVTLAAAVQENVFQPYATYMSGHIKIGKHTIRDVNRKGWGEISFLEGLKRSSNLAFIKMALDGLGEEKLKDYIERFGFGKRTGIEMAGELSGIVRLQNITDVATASFGQGGVVVTPIQQVVAVSAVANGGKLIQPHLLRQIEDPITKKKTMVKPKIVRNVISQETSKKVGEYLEQVVSDRKIGTGRFAYIDGYRIAGKTGTAQKVFKGKYAVDKHVYSFIGYGPVENPKIVLQIIVDEPEEPKIAPGASIVPPAFKEIMSKTLSYLKVPPHATKTEAQTIKNDQAVIPPAVKNLAVNAAKEKLTKKGFKVQVIGKGEKVLAQFPENSVKISKEIPIYILTEKATVDQMPEMTGLSLREVIEICEMLHLPFTVEGEGYVASQSPQNGLIHFVLKPNSYVEPKEKEETETKETAEETEPKAEP